MDATSPINVPSNPNDVNELIHVLNFISSLEGITKLFKAINSDKVS